MSARAFLLGAAAVGLALGVRGPGARAQEPEGGSAWTRVLIDGDPRPSPRSEDVLPAGFARRDVEPRLAAEVLERNGALTDRFSQAGQSVTYSFEARAGELSILELRTVGYTRGWSSAARIRVLDPAGRPLVDDVESGGTVYGDFLCFVAPMHGVYGYELTAARESFCFAVVRHSDFAPNVPARAFELERRDAVYGYLADDADRVTYAVELEAGEDVALRALNARAEVQRNKRLERREALRGSLSGAGPAAAMAGMARGMMDSMQRAADAPSGGGDAAMRGRMSARGEPAEPSQPDLALEVEGAGRTLARGSHFAWFTAPSAGTYWVHVNAAGPAEGGFFRLEQQRDVATHAVRGRVADLEDLPRAGVRVSFLREPELDPVGTAVSGEDGLYSIDVPPGAYALVLSADAARRAELVQVGIERDREVNLIFGGRP